MTDDKLKRMHCGRTESEHRGVFEPHPKPGTCVCDPSEWTRAIPPVCGAYQGNGVDYCQKCEHDHACHRDVSFLGCR